MPNENEELQKKIDDGVRERLASFSKEDFQELRKNNPAVRSIVDSETNKGTHTGSENALAKMKEESEVETDTKRADAATALELERHKFMLQAVKEGIAPDIAEKLSGSYEDRLAAIGDVKTQERKEFLKRNGRTPHISLHTEPGLYDRLDKLPADMLAKISPGLIDKAGEEMMSQGRKSRGQSLREELFGGKK